MAIPDRRREQLQMILPEAKARAMPQHPMPDGFTLRALRKGVDDEAFVELLRSAGFEQWDLGMLESAYREALPDGVFVIVNDATGELAATAMAGHHPTELHPSGGELGWVAAKPHLRGKGLGRAACSAAIRRFAAAGYHRVYLKTDDFRLPAIKVYSALGFEPFLFLPDMRDRWREICKQLSLPFTPDAWIGVTFEKRKPLFDVKDVDREFYESRIEEFLPEHIIDIHTHVWEKPRKPAKDSRVVSWPSRVAAVNPVEDLLETYELMLPGKKATPLIFGTPTLHTSLDAQNSYCAYAANEHKLPALMLSRPEWTPQQLEEQIRAGGFIGVKPYLTFAPAYIPANEIRIYDFLPPQHLDVLDRNGWMAILHVPRSGRLGDIVNLQQMIEIDARYPNAKVVIAHVGRAYCVEDTGDAFNVLAGSKNLLFDISANTNRQVFRELLECVGPRRVLFGSDMPILRMRMRRICEEGRYVNIVPRGLYGDVSNDANMREVDGEEAGRLSFFLYEEIDAFLRAAEEANLSRYDIADVFHGNAARVLTAAGWRV